jgi:hypothetical protein
MTMTLPYSQAKSGADALEETQKILTGFGCARFGTMHDMEKGELIVQFTHHQKEVLLRASWRGYAAAWLKENPWSTRRAGTQKEHEAKALAQAKLSVCSIVRDWIKGQITAVEVGILSFEGAFLGQILLNNGKTVLEHVEAAQLLALKGPK